MTLKVSTKSRRRRLSLIVTGAVTALLVSGCAVGSTGEETSDAGSELSSASVSIAVNAPPRSWDPSQLDGGQQAYLWASVFDTLLYLDNDGEIQPNAAEEWEYSDDARTLTLKLREGMTFSSGDPVTAEAVKFTLDRNKETPGQQQPKMWAIESVDAPDETTVVINLSTPDPALLPNLAMELGAIGDPATLDDGRTATDPIASGPYVLNAASSVTGSSYALERRDDYWNAGKYPFKTVTIKILPDTTAATNSLLGGQVDVSTVPAAQLAQFEQGAYGITRVPVQSVAYLVLADRDGTQLEPLGDVRVREAINLAFDRDPMVEQLLRGVGQSTSQIFNPFGSAYVPALEDGYAYDPERARELLADAGYPDGFDINMPSTVVSTAFQPTISEFLGDIGIGVTWDAVPAQNVTASVAAADYPVYFFVVSSEPTVGREVHRQLHSGSQNPFGWTSPELQALEDEAYSALDPAEQDEAFAALAQYVFDEALFAPLFYIGTAIVTTDDVLFLGDGSNILPTIRTLDVAE